MRKLIPYILILMVIVLGVRLSFEYNIARRESALNEVVPLWSYDPRFQSYKAITVLIEYRDSGICVTDAGEKAGF